MSDQSGLPLVFLDGGPSDLPDVCFARRRIAKRGFDIVVSALALLLLAPLFVLVVLGIRANSPGPAFVRQKREGFQGREIEIIKFRSMYSGYTDCTGLQQAIRNDPRVTSIGRALRRKSIDELPQLIAVLKGDMSLVGPRPHVFGMRAGGIPYDDLVPYYATRHSRMKPGMTGWAQVNGLRGPTDDARLARLRIDHDMAYIQNHSLWLDARILFRTVRQELLAGSGD